MFADALAAFTRMHAAHAAFVDSYKTPRRPAAILESDAADAAFMASMVGLPVLVKAEWEPGGFAPGVVRMAFERGDVRTEHGVNCWGEFCPASYSPAEVEAFFQAEQQLSERARALDAADAAPVQTSLVF